jgi:hypothetical protein
MVVSSPGDPRDVGHDGDLAVAHPGIGIQSRVDPTGPLAVSDDFNAADPGPRPTRRSEVAVGARGLVEKAIAHRYADSFAA